MKILIERSKKITANENIKNNIILSLKNYSVQSNVYYELEEIKNICKNKEKNEIFININKNLLNEDIEPLTKILIELDKLDIKGIFFYDIALVQLKKELDLKIDLIWSQTHMVNNYKTCNYYYSKGVKYALLGKEITLEEIKEIITKSKIISMVEVIGLPSVAFSKRKLISNYYKDLNKKPQKEIIINETITNKNYILEEDENGTSFYLDEKINGTGVIKELYEIGTNYIIIREFGLEEIFEQLIEDTEKYIDGQCLDEEYINKYKILGNNTNFFFKKTIYQVKKNG